MIRAEEAQRLMREAAEFKWPPAEGSKIANFYKGKSVFVTGATGFLGKLLVEKLLRACPDINAVYILVRPKKGEDEHTRIDKLYSNTIFEPLTKIFPKFQHKISVIKGDVAQPGLGINLDDQAVLIHNVNVIFHIAATVKFDEKITLATAINVRGTRDLLKLAKQCKNLASFVHVSTAYTNCNQEKVEEIFYNPPITADELINLVEQTPEEIVLQRTEELIGDWPNTYTFTKAIAENAVKKYSKDLPVCLFRPAIVVATYKEPLRSWIDNLNGATGILVGGGIGLLRTLHCDGNQSAEIVPGDYVINCMISASFRTAMEKVTNEVPIYNYISSVENRLTWFELMEHNFNLMMEIPTIRCMWYCTTTMNRYYFMHRLYCIFLHFLPALIMDLGMLVTRRKPIMVKIYKKIEKFESVISHFTTNEWKFQNDNTQSLWNYLSDADQNMFRFSMRELDWNDYHKTHALGLRIYVVKDDVSTLPQARKKWKRFYIANQVIKAIFYLVVIILLYSLLARVLLFSTGS